MHNVTNDRGNSKKLKTPRISKHNRPRSSNRTSKINVPNVDQNTKSDADRAIISWGGFVALQRAKARISRVKRQRNNREYKNYEKNMFEWLIMHRLFSVS